MSESNDEKDSITFEEFFEFHSGMIEEEEEAFPGDVPDQGVSSILKAAQKFDSILMRAEIQEANEDVDTEGIDDAIDRAMEEQAVDLLAAIGTLQHEHGLDIESVMRERIEMAKAIRSADSMEELQEALGQADVDMSVGSKGIQPGDDVSREDYDPDDPHRGIQ